MRKFFIIHYLSFLAFEIIFLFVYFGFAADILLFLRRIHYPMQVLLFQPYNMNRNVNKLLLMAKQKPIKKNENFPNVTPVN